MTIYVFCADRDLRTDADLYAGVVRGTRVTSLRDVDDEDTVILYTHGVYSTATGTAVASNLITWQISSSDAQEQVGAVACGTRLTGTANLPAVENLTIIVHACFSAGTIEAPPARAANTETFAGQLCSSLRASFNNLRVVGLQGSSKVGKAGFAATGPVSTRASRRTTDPNQGDLWSVVYTWDGSAVAVESAGTSVRWS